MKGIENNTNIYSLPGIISNKIYNCIEYFNINEKFQFGIKIYMNNIEIQTIIFFNSDIINYKNFKYHNNSIFDPILISHQFFLLNSRINYLLNKNISLINSFSLKKHYIRNLYCTNKYSNLFKENIWIYRNIYNIHFCFCKGQNCSYYSLTQECKYLFYLNIIDNNKLLYNKTDYLLADFFFNGQSSDDTYPIFLEMIKQNISAHYMDEKKSIYLENCKEEKNCIKIIPIINHKYKIDGDFLEKYLDIILRLKSVIAGGEFISIYNIFHDIDYITYINLGHGVKYFKNFLYKDYSSPKKYNKILLPPSDKIISVAKKYGWTDNNIIKNCLPKWDRYDIYKNNKSQYNNETNISKSIFIIFTWRMMNSKLNISTYYFNNIYNLINNNILKDILIKNNITLYFALHHMFLNYINDIKINKWINFINETQIADCLLKTNLLITDFSSVIFDMIYQKKPYIMYIPDAFDPNLKKIYIQGYYDIINGLINGSIYFENIYLNINKTINKIKYYINNNFRLELKLINFYDSFGFKCGNNTKNFINYLQNN